MNDKAGSPITIPARKGKAVRLGRGQHVRVMNPTGQQVVDTWAFNANNLAEFQSNEHTRAFMLRLVPRVGDQLYTNQRRPILTLVEDSSPGIHDMLIAACDPARYELLGCTEYHDNCQDNLHAALAELGLASAETPSPLNLFMNIPWRDNDISFEESPARPGDHVVLRAEMSCVVVFSACPQDIVKINGLGRKPTHAEFVVF
jgi:uncharacterized protein YcgI (DUF1989 family)